MLDAEFHLALHVGFIFVVFDLAARKTVEQMHRQLRLVDSGNRLLLVRRGLVRRRHIGDDGNAFALQFCGDAPSQGAQRIGGVGQKYGERITRLRLR